ncbi:MAG: fructose-specific PTS transporter subunit EIIC [Lachnospiraceae bacterium]|nr:fructose-specific PTS transporter subunit EIIC [Eubacteriales bacterium]MDY2606721.1 fructose-specific PTS transporter subunit EIIC [Lachnospiraceae bacterium]
MKITDLLGNSVSLNQKAASKDEVLEKVVDLMCEKGNITDKAEYLQAVRAREEEGTTGVGDGIAIPHGRCMAVNAPGLAAMVLPDGVDYEALDDEPVHLIFLIAAPANGGDAHIEMLSKLSTMLMDEEFTANLRNAKSKEEFISIIDKAENERNMAESEKASAENSVNAGTENAVNDSENANKDVKFIVAVTACPTGIAHTYMAAEALEKKAKEIGCKIKVETRGSGGAKNVLTESEIERAEAVIVAADTKVPMSRFNGKKVIEVQVSDGISKADKLINRALNGDAPVYKSNGGSEEGGSSKSSGSDSIGHQIYKHLMNGVSHMLPFVVGGGILIAIAFLIDGLSVDINSLSAAERGNFGTITPTAAMFKSIGGTAFNFMLPILAGFIAMSIADRPGLAVGFVGGSIAATGSSGFLGALAAGFIAGYLVKLLMKLTEKFPKSLDGIRPILIYPLFGVLICGLIMNYIIEPVVGMINTGLNNGLGHLNGVSSVLLGIIVAGMMAIDMGGPFNKAAYVFGTASIAAGNYNIMAAVMIGGMVPPCAIALATLLFKNRFTEDERKAGPTNFIMGLSFITEGAIPFAAADPLHVIPACVIGSGLAGALSMAFKCTLMAPHGGIFVFPVVGNGLLYFLALVIGTVVSTFMLGLLKKPITK